RLPAVLGARRFDVVFTVSVLIHNAPETLSSLLADLKSALKEDGCIVLVENKLVNFGVWENAWHGGCWLHAYPDLLEAGWDMEIEHGSIDTHDVYILRANGLSERRLFRLQDGASRPLPDDELQRLGMEKLRRWAANVSHTPGDTDGLARMRISELEERLRVQ